MIRAPGQKRGYESEMQGVSGHFVDDAPGVRRERVKPFEELGAGVGQARRVERGDPARGLGLGRSAARQAPEQLMKIAAFAGAVNQRMRREESARQGWCPNAAFRR